MKLKRLGPSCAVLELSNGGAVLFSYDVPVAADVPASYKGLKGDTQNGGEPGKSKEPAGLWRTDTFFSRTTSGHITKWLAGRTARTVKQSTIEEFTREVR